ncbi:MAG: acyltransferase [Gemmataceae bacterium]|nr:acyltransferase [Gemmataceae bacterium]
MTQPAGRNLPLSHGRRFICDLMHASRHVPHAALRRRMELAPLVAARQAACPRPSWLAIFLKAYSFVAAARPELRRVYMPFPWPHLYEHPHSVASVAVERRLDDEDMILFAHFRSPHQQGLQAIDDGLRRYKEAPLDSLPLYRRMRRVTRLPRPVRRLLWWAGLSLSGHRRARLLGTFGVSTVSNAGAALHEITSPVTTTLSYGVFRPDGSVDVHLTFDHRVVDGAPLARALEDMERVLRCEILAELRYFQALDAA